MTSGRLVVIAIVLVTAVFAGAQWWFQTRAYYEPIESADLLVTLADGSTEALAIDGFSGIDADTSPLRFRGCFTVADPAALVARAAAYPEAAPLIALSSIVMTPPDGTETVPVLPGLRPCALPARSRSSIRTRRLPKSATTKPVPASV